MAKPSVIVFDVNETLSDMSPMSERFAEAGVPAELARTWFASVLRDGFALAVTGDNEKFAFLADGVLRAVLAGASVNRLEEDAVEHILAGFAELEVHPDVPEGVRLLAGQGMRLVTLSNGSPDVAERLLGHAGILGEFERLISVEDAEAWKPARAAYEHAARVCGTDVSQMLLVAVHPWDIHGAHRAGLRTGWLARQPAPYPAHFVAPDLQAADLAGLARLILA